MEDNDFNEYNDQDATDCSNGDYNTWEENQLAQDNEGADDSQFTEWDGDSDGSVGCD